MSLSRNRWLGLAGVALVIGSASVLACGGDDTSTPTPAKDGGAVADTGTTVTGDAGSSLYSRLGGHSGISAFVGQVVTKVLMDPRQASYFVFQTTGTTAGGHPTPAQIIECFTDLVGSATGGMEVYPPADTTATTGFVCRSMTAAHASLHIPNGVFNDFVAVIVSIATSAGISSTDIATMGALLMSTQPMIVDTARADDGGYYDGPMPETATDGGPADAGPG